MSPSVSCALVCLFLQFIIFGMETKAVAVDTIDRFDHCYILELFVNYLQKVDKLMFS